MAGRQVGPMRFANVYPLYVAKCERKDRAQSEVDEVICWLTGYTQDQLIQQTHDSSVTMQAFFDQAPQMNPNRTLIKGVVCGVRVQDVEDPFMRDVRYLDKLIDELAKGKPMAKVLRMA